VIDCSLRFPRPISNPRAPRAGAPIRIEPGRRISYCALLEAGFVKGHSLRTISSRRGYAYPQTSNRIVAKAEPTRKFQTRKLEEQDAFRVARDLLRTERADGRTQAHDLAQSRDS